MNKLHALIPATAALAAAFTLHPATPRGDELDPRDIVARAKVSLVQVLANAAKACPGAAYEAALEGEMEKGKLEVFFEVMVVGDDGKLHELRFDPASGQLIEDEDVTATEEGEELGEARAVLRQCELQLADLIAKASAVVNGTPVSAALELEHGNPSCDVAIVNGRHLIEAEVEARAGHLTELELVVDEQEHEHGEHDAHHGKREEMEEEEEEEGEEHAHGEQPGEER